MKYVLEFEIEDLPKTYNSMGRSHWAVKVKEAKKWIRYVELLTIGKRPPAPLEKARVTLTRISSVCPDADGLCSSFKHVIDGLTRAQVITDDNFSVIGMPTFIWEKGKPRQGKIRVKVESVE